MFLFISEKDVFARQGEFESRVSESQTGILPFILSGWSEKKFKLYLPKKTLRSSISSDFQFLAVK